jgi:hypothetical protein
MRTNRLGWARACALLAAGIAAVLWAAGAWAAAVVADLEGDVRVAAPGAQSRAIVPGQRVDAGSRVSTARGARVLLRFDDGQWAALHEDTELRIERYHFQPSEPAADRATLVLLRGVLRIITGTLGHRNPEAFELRAPNIIVGVRGTDFMLAAAGTTYLQVLEGTVVAVNAGGRATFSAGELGFAAEEASPAAAVAAGALPAAVASAFGDLRARRIVPPESAAPPGRDLESGPQRDRGAAPPAPGRERARGIGSKGRVK